MIFTLDNGGATKFFASTITTNNTFSAGTYNYTAISASDTSSWDLVSFIFQNPFSGIAFLAWLSVGILLTDIYIIVTSVIP